MRPSWLTAAVVLVEDDRFPLVTAPHVPCGDPERPIRYAGLAESVERCWWRAPGRVRRTDRGTNGGDRRKHRRQRHADGLTLGGLALSESAGKLLELMADVARNASFPENEVGLHKQNSKQALLQEAASPAYLANRKFSELVYGKHPYAHVGPTMQSLEKLDRNAVVSFRDRYLTPNNAS
jgi:hypothetical protein